jgi:hypothetical protein
VDTLPEVPPGVEITVARDAGGVTLSWAAYKTGAGCLAFGLFGWAARPTQPESVRLEADRLQYFPGSGPSESRSCADLPGGGVMPVTPSPAADVPRAAIRGFVIDRVSNRQRLYFDANDTRTEIGGCLTEAERAWLFAVLQQWVGEPRPARQWARPAAL